MTAPALAVAEMQRVALQRMAGSSTLRHRHVVQAKALLWAADGVLNWEIIGRGGVDSDTVRRWRMRFEAQGFAEVGVIAKRRGRGSRLLEGTVAEMVW